VQEPLLRRPGQQIRPFVESAGVTARCCSLPLQRAITDFGADHAFGQLEKNLQEHYGITMPTSSCRKITESHAHRMDEQQATTEIPVINSPGCAVQIGELDGCMLPIVSVDNTADDKRKHKTLHWQEARLALVREQGCLTPRFGATFSGSVDTAGERLKACALAAGFGTETHFHSVGDGAPWIAHQVQDKFADQGRYLIDFYHVCDYLADAAKSCCAESEDDWLEKQKVRLKHNEVMTVIESLQPYLEAAEVEDSKAPVRACHRYLSNRTEQVDYQSALEKGLPIGSGEVESAHRYVIQKRLKLSGAWWKAENIDPMLSLRVVRANEQWDAYWDNLAEAA